MSPKLLHLPQKKHKEGISLFHFIKFHIHQYFFRCNTKKEKEIQSKSDKFLQTGQEPSNTVSSFSVSHYCRALHLQQLITVLSVGYRSLTKQTTDVDTQYNCLSCHFRLNNGWKLEEKTKAVPLRHRNLDTKLLIRYAQ